jgi:transposase
MLGFKDTYANWQKGCLNCEEAGALLGISERSFRRWKDRFEAEGESGLADRRVGKPSNRKAQDWESNLVIKLYAEKYRGFNVSHYHNFLVRNHDFKRGYDFVKRTLEKSKLISKSTRGGKHRLRRARKPMTGMMLHQDASTHNWFGEGKCDLVVTMDDASSEIYSAFFCPQEGTESSLRGIKEVIEQKGLFCSFYTDRGSHYWFTPEAGGKVDKNQLTQVGRALKMLGIQHIAAYSPQARGRSERMFATLQDRLVKELKLNNINSMDEANNYLHKLYLPCHNQQFTVEATEKQTAFLAYVGRDLAEILCVQEGRVVASDNTVSYNGKTLQIQKDEARYHYAKCEVIVHEKLDKTIAIFYGNRCIG